MCLLSKLVFVTGGVVASVACFAQQTTILDTTSSKTKAVVIAGKQYNRSSFHNFLWGKHYRAEWATPVSIKVLTTDTVFGGLKPLKKGGGRQTRNAHIALRR
jgi:hypothetical protein